MVTNVDKLELQTCVIPPSVIVNLTVYDVPGVKPVNVWVGVVPGLVKDILK